MATLTAPDSAAEATERARNTSLLSPRFYRTDYKALDRLDMAPVRADFDALISEFERDGNRNHFERDASFRDEIRELPPALHAEFIDFLVSSITAEFSGCVLYNEIKKHVRNPDIRRLMSFMARDEARHARFINRSLEDFGRHVDLGFLRRAKRYTYFRPKFIYYATYLSEKIGYARYITIYRQLERNPELRFHPIFRWFERWCHDEFRHGEAFAVIMRANPDLVRGVNRLWIRFFLLAVFATMYVRDHNRPEMHRAFGLDPDSYDYAVLGITSEITRQVFPFTLDLDSPRFRAGLTRLSQLDQAMGTARAAGGFTGKLKLAVLGAQAGLTFVRLYLLPVQRHDLPHSVRLSPAW